MKEGGRVRTYLRPELCAEVSLQTLRHRGGGKKREEEEAGLGNTAPTRLGKSLPNALMNLTCSLKYVSQFITQEAYYLEIAT